VHAVQYAPLRQPPKMRPMGRGSRGVGPPVPCAFNSLLRYGDVDWTEQEGRVDQLTLRGCPLRRFSHAQARQCLAGKRLVFVGDSITR
jgi:hypothetical protein